MAKKLLIFACVVLCTAGIAYSQTLAVSGEMKTGVYWERIDATGQKLWIKARMYDNDDAGDSEGRFRMNLALTSDTIGMKVQFEQTSWTAAQPNQWSYAFVWANFIQNQLKVTAGRLGESPWSIGYLPIPIGFPSNLMLEDLDKQSKTIGIRTEIMPKIVPGLNIGFVLNGWNNSFPTQANRTLADLLEESVVGATYENEYLRGSFSYRFDSKLDTFGGKNEGMDMMYLLQEKVLSTKVEGLSMWANGWWKGIGINETGKNYVNLTNYLYVQWAPQEYTSQLRLSYQNGPLNSSVRHEVYAKLSFYYNIFPWLSAGLAGNYYENYGSDKQLYDTTNTQMPYRLWNIQPRIRATISPNSYIEIEYCYENGFLSPSGHRNTQWMNLRTVYTY